MSISRRQSMIDSGHARLSIVRQCVLLKIARSGLYYEKIGESPLNLALMREIDRAFTEWPFLGVPKEFGHWHAVYVRMRRWVETGVLTNIFQKLQQEQIIAENIDHTSLDSTFVKIHPDGTGALKKRKTGYR